MVLKVSELKNIAGKLLSAIGSSELASINEMLGLEVIDESLILSVTNREYYVSVKVPLGYSENFNATVNASLFLNLISQTTTEDIELACQDRYLYIKGNGQYKLPLAYDGDTLLILPKINIYNPTCKMEISTDILQSILRYNSKELTKGTIALPVQNYYYVDERGCITFTTGACVNMFSLEKPVKMLLNTKLIKLFKLFTQDKVKFTLGYDALSDSIIQTKVIFEDDYISVTSILGCDDTLLNSVPVTNIRGRAETIYPYSIVINKEELLQAINRLLLFNKKAKTKALNIGHFMFSKSNMVIMDTCKENQETINYLNDCTALQDTAYEASINLDDFRSTLIICDEAYLTLNFGKDGALTISRTGVINIIPESENI